MNKNDSELMVSSLKKKGYRRVEKIDDARIVIYNTCSVRQHAEDRVLARIKIVKKIVRGRKGVIAVTGCMAQRNGRKLIETGLADLVVGPYESPNIGELIEIYLHGKDNNTFLSQDTGNFHARILTGEPDTLDDFFWHKWVTITHGCENFCSYCIVPHVRGRLISFRSETILSYIKSLAENGIREISLLGQNVNQYGTDTGDIPFYRLLEKAAALRGLVRVNFLTSHPRDFTEDIVKVIRDHENISRSIHLPLQSGSDKILGMMNRNYSMDHYLTVTGYIKKHLEEYSITTDLIVGYPGEDENDFQDTLRAVEKIGFDDAFMYAYSPRENTPAWDLKDELSRSDKIARLERLISLQKKISRGRLESRIDKTEMVIVERMSKKSGSEVMGKTFLNHPVVLSGSAGDIGSHVMIKIEKLTGNTLQGKRIG